MAGELSLKTPATGLVTLSPANTATDKTITIPATTGTMVVQDGTNTTTITNLAYTGTLTGGTGVINIGSGQVYKDASGNVGIGTSSPSSYGKFAIGLSATGSATNNVIGIYQAAGVDAAALRIAGFNYAGNAQTAIDFVQNSNSNFQSQIVFSTNGGSGITERMRLDSSGNLGLGVTPSAWGSPFKAIQFATNGQYIAGQTNAPDMKIGTNHYFNGSNYVYTVTGSPASRFDIGASTSAGFAWNIAPSGTAGNTVSFTQAMTLSANGNLVIGATSDIARFRAVSSTGGGISIAQGTENFYGASSHRFFTDNYAAEVVRIDSSGNLLVGTQTTPTGGYDGRIMVQASGNTSLFKTTAAANSGIAVGCVRDTNGIQIAFSQSGSLLGTIQTNGSATAYNTSSDYRLKENVAPMTGALAKVAALKPCTYTWKADGSDGQGFIAHELQAVCPQAVTGEKDAVDEDGNPKYQGVDTSFLVATLTAAIQELTARLEVLENK